jgi:hypothetical protein
VSRANKGTRRERVLIDALFCSRTFTEPDSYGSQTREHSARRKRSLHPGTKSEYCYRDRFERVRLKTIVLAILGKGSQTEAHPEKRRYPIDRLWERDFRQRVPFVGRQHTPLSSARDHSR